MSHVGRLVTNAIIANLTTDGLIVGDGEAPTTGGWSGVPGESTFVGYVVVHPLPGGRTDGPLDASDDDASPVYQLSAYGMTREQCENLADLARDIILDVPLVVPGRHVAHVRVDMLGGARRDDTHQPPLWHCVDRYRITTTPA